MSCSTARAPQAQRIRRIIRRLCGWILLRGDHDSVAELAMPLGMKFKRDARGQFAHSNLVTVLNRNGEIIRQNAGLHVDQAPFIKFLTETRTE